MLWETEPVSIDRWRKHRGRMMANAHAGHRPQEWWLYERQMVRPYEDEAATLYEMGELSEAELAELLLRWREWYEQANEPGFSYCAGNGHWLEGAAARRAQYKWAGIPRTFLQQWNAERKRRTKVIRKLVKVTT